MIHREFCDTEDADLLGLAAKSANMSVTLWRNGYVLNNEKTEFGSDIGWNPLTDDGDALRLAVKLNMFDYRRFLELRLEETRVNPKRSDAEITRRAIVRVAAEIGKSTGAA